MAQDEQKQKEIHQRNWRHSLFYNGQRIQQRANWEGGSVQVQEGNQTGKNKKRKENKEDKGRKQKIVSCIGTKEVNVSSEKQGKKLVKPDY